jgi:adenine-specific DNA-methyltransferase
VFDVEWVAGVVAVGDSSQFTYPDKVAFGIAGRMQRLIALLSSLAVSPPPQWPRYSRGLPALRRISARLGALEPTEYRAMPSLDFKGKSFIYTHHLGVPYRELLVVPEKSEPAGGTPDLDGNLIIHGDNLEALKALLPRYAGRVDCIYIDPPYNTGTEGWCYNDAVNAPLMREWLKKAANPVERDDLQRHDKWLCMMWPRLQLLKELLAEDGAIFVSIDDNEVHRLRAVMDEVFGEDNFVATFIWRKVDSPNDNKVAITPDHEMILCYANDAEAVGFGPKNDASILEGYSTKDESGRLYRDRLLKKNGKNSLRSDRPTMFFALNDPDGNEVFPIHDNGEEARWAAGVKMVEKHRANGTLIWKRRERRGKIVWEPYTREFAPDVPTRPHPTIWADLPTMRQAKAMLTDIFAAVDVFATPKPVQLIERILEIATDKNSLVLDSYAGSGTTGHAVTAMNARDGGNRRFILLQCDEYNKQTGETIDLCNSLTAERVRRVIRGYDYTGTHETELHPPEKVTWTTFAKDKTRNEILERIEGIRTLEGAKYDKIETKIIDGVLTVVGRKQVEEKMPGLGGGFTYVELGEAMDLERLLAETPGTLPSFAALARYLFFTATGHTLRATETSATPKPVAKAKGNGKSKPAPETAPTDAPVLIGDTAVWRIYLHYRPDEAWLRSPAAAFTRSQAEVIAAESKGTGKQALVFAAAKFINHKSLRDLKVEFAQLPYALHRVQAE